MLFWELEVIAEATGSQVVMGVKWQLRWRDEVFNTNEHFVFPLQDRAAQGNFFFMPCVTAVEAWKI
jgi:hypothetical protein